MTAREDIKISFVFHTALKSTLSIFYLLAVYYPVP